MIQSLAPEHESRAMGDDDDSGIDYAAANVAKNAPRWLKALKRFGYWPETAAA